MTQETQLLHVAPGEEGIRIDIWLADRIAGLSRSRVQALLKSGDILVDGKKVRPNLKTREGMRADVSIPPVRDIHLAPEDIPLEILHEDGDIIVVNKPPGLVVHPAAGHSSGTLVNTLLFHCKDLQGIGGELRPGIVHRLDKDTSGLLVAAKNESAMEIIQAQFRARTVQKEYLALVHGVPERKRGEIRTLLGRSRADRKKMSAYPASGREAVTHFSVDKSSSVVSLVRLNIETGRTHQIRVHMSHIGHPVIGDRQYGSSAGDKRLPIRAGRQMLHARKLVFRHPANGEKADFTAPVWRDMADLIEKLGLG